MVYTVDEVLFSIEYRLKVGSQYETRACVTSCYVTSPFVMHVHNIIDAMQYVTSPNSSTTPPTYKIISYRLVYKM